MCPAPASFSMAHISQARTTSMKAWADVDSPQVPSPHTPSGSGFRLAQVLGTSSRVEMEESVSTSSADSPQVLPCPIRFFFGGGV